MAKYKSPHAEDIAESISEEKEVSETVVVQPIKESESTTTTTGYPIYEQWKVDAVSKGEGKWQLECVSMMRSDVRIEEYTANLLNEQSHNSLSCYFLKGTVTNGTKTIVSSK